MDLAQIRHVATLAELSLTDEEATRMATEVGRILAYVAELDAVDTTNVPPTAHVSAMGSGGGLRPDAVVEGLSHADALAQAPRAEHGGFVVPTFVG